ncbi:MAG TPA: hypothetical protein VFE20_04780 [Thermoleophilia bacterium]|nr:hypothetical protein [Thermoleophilia bacterium]
MPSSKKLVVGAVLIGAFLALATPALAQSGAPGPAPGVAAGICNGVGVAAERVTDLLGLTSEEIQDERLAGKSLADIAADEDVPQDELVEAMLEPRRAAMEQAVADGRITKEQSELRLEQMEQMVRERTSSEELGNGFGRSGARGGLGGGCGGGGGMGGGLGAGCGGAPSAETTSL